MLIYSSYYVENKTKVPRLYLTLHRKGTGGFNFPKYWSVKMPHWKFTLYCHDTHIHTRARAPFCLIITVALRSGQMDYEVFARKYRNFPCDLLVKREDTFTLRCLNSLVWHIYNSASKVSIRKLKIERQEQSDSTNNVNLLCQTRLATPIKSYTIYRLWNKWSIQFNKFTAPSFSHGTEIPYFFHKF
jgi:hypothetical protein